MLSAFPDHAESVEVILEEGYVVAVKYKISGTHLGNFFGMPATGKKIEIDSTASFHLEDGKITEGWFMAHEVALLRQLDSPMPNRSDGKSIILPILELSKDDDAESLSGDGTLKKVTR
ncbi:MAG: ester cyclase [Acidiferrobacterales bacterium]|nr:ester cyclase [Acidiferrobacterales bacterium]